MQVYIFVSRYPYGIDTIIILATSLTHAYDLLEDEGYDRKDYVINETRPVICGIVAHIVE